MDIFSTVALIARSLPRFLYTIIVLMVCLAIGAFISSAISEMIVSEVVSNYLLLIGTSGGMLLAIKPITWIWTTEILKE